MRFPAKETTESSQRRRRHKLSAFQYLKAFLSSPFRSDSERSFCKTQSLQFFPGKAADIKAFELCNPHLNSCILRILVVFSFSCNRKSAQVPERAPHQAEGSVRVHRYHGDGGARLRVGRVPLEDPGQPGPAHQHHHLQLRAALTGDVRGGRGQHPARGLLRDRGGDREGRPEAHHAVRRARATDEHLRVQDEHGVDAVRERADAALPRRLPLQIRR